MPMFARAAGVHSRTHSHQADVGRQACTQVLLVLHTSCTHTYMYTHTHLAALHTRCAITQKHMCALQVLLLLHTSCTRISVQAHACNTQACTLVVAAHRHTCVLRKCCWCCTLIAHTRTYMHTQTLIVQADVAHLAHSCSVQAHAHVVYTALSMLAHFAGVAHPLYAQTCLHTHVGCHLPCSASAAAVVHAHASVHKRCVEHCSRVQGTWHECA